MSATRTEICSSSSFIHESATQSTPRHPRSACSRTAEDAGRIAGHRNRVVRHSTLKTRGKIFAVFELYKGELSLALQIEKKLQPVFLKDLRFYLTP